MLNFTTDQEAPRRSIIDGAEPITFTVDDDEFTALPPTPEQFAWHIREQNHKDLSRRVASIINFLDGLLVDDSKERFNERLLDPDDPMDMEMVSDIIAGLIEAWSANPTESPSGSSSSRKSTGGNSTAKRRSKASTS